MNTTIVYGLDKKNSLFLDLEKSRTVFLARSVKEAHFYHIDHSEVDSYIIYPGKLYSQSLLIMIEQIQYLNSIITIIIYRPQVDNRKLFNNKKNIRIVDEDEDIPEILKNLPKYQRDANRVRWPLMVEYWKTVNDDELKHTGVVLSISSSGCFIRVVGTSEIEVKEPIYMTFYFRDFDFFSEGTVVRLKTDGIAVGFYDVTPQTQQCIQSIINERILKELMETLKPKREERKEGN